MNIRHRAEARWLLPLLAGALLYLPLRAAEAPPSPAAEPPAGAEQPADPPRPAPDRAQGPAPKAEDAAEQEQISLDSNLSFPVDI